MGGMCVGGENKHGDIRDGVSFTEEFHQKQLLGERVTPLFE